MKRPTMLVQAMLDQLAMDLDLSVERDKQRIACRCEHEGLSFLTITLPLLSDALERGLEAGTFTCPTQFSRHGSLPRFLGGFFKRVFDKDGKLLPDACPYTVKGIRQVCRFFKKLKLGCSPRRETKAAQHFLEVEGELRQMTSQIERKDIILDKISGIIWAQVFPELDGLDLVCHHGPGVTADRYLANARHRISKWPGRSELTFPSDLHCFPNYGVAAEHGESTDDDLGAIRHLRLREEEPVRVVFVPKTQSAPRVIAIEPSHMQYMQQSLKDYVYTILENHSLTRHSIRFTRQDVNQRLAYRSSIDKRLSTLDLKDASDRVHLSLVQRIFKNSGILEYLEDSRSLHATLPTGANIVLSKFASMGSAMCFPVEAMVFYTLIQSAMHAQDGRRPSSRSIARYSRKIDVYGDDIIVPTDYTDTVVRYLESYALKVNVSKSFKDGNFRESCGADYFKGIPVNPVYARMFPHDNVRHWGPEEVMSWTATADLFYLRGQWHIAQVIRDQVSQAVRRSIPKTRKLGSGLAFFSLLFSTNLRYDRDLQGWKQKRLHYDPIKRKDSIDGDEIACLNKWGIHSRIRQDSRGFEPRVPWSNRGYGEASDADCSSRSRELRDSDGTRGSLSSSLDRCENRPRSETHVDARVGYDSLRHLQDTCGGNWENPILLPAVASDGKPSVTDTAEQRRLGILEATLANRAKILDPLEYLDGRSVGLDFFTSVKRGSFKSKCRWVSLAG